MRQRRPKSNRQPKRGTQKPSQPAIELSPEACAALDLFEETRQHVFLTGRAGTGKSTLLQHFRHTTRKRLAVLAPTGVAAVNVQGQTWLTDKSQPHYFSSRFLVLKAETGLATHGILLFRCHRGFGVRFTA